jgi:hypothetical protein
MGKVTIMRRLAGLSLLILVGVVLTGCAGSAAPRIEQGKPAQSFAGGARLALEQRSIDYGKVQFNQQVKATFNAKNVGDKPLAIRKVDVKTVQGCWPPEPVVGSTTLKPGQSTDISVSFTMHDGMGGPHQFDLVVNSNDPVEPAQAVSVLAEFPPNSGK